MNAWVSYGGRCYLVAPEHLRTLAPDEVCSTKPLVRQGLEKLRKASKSLDHVDITRQEATASEAQQAAEKPPGNDLSAEPIESVVLPPLASEVPIPGEPLETLEPAPEAAEQPPQEIVEMEDDVANPLRNQERRLQAQQHLATTTGIEQGAQLKWTSRQQRQHQPPGHPRGMTTL